MWIYYFIIYYDLNITIILYNICYKLYIYIINNYTCYIYLLYSIYEYYEIHSGKYTTKYY